MAERKGYSSLRWFFAGGLVGLLILAFLPFANAPEASPEEQARRLRKGNAIGLTLTVIVVALCLLRLAA